MAAHGPAEPVIPKPGGEDPRTRDAEVGRFLIEQDLQQEVVVDDYLHGRGYARSGSSAATWRASLEYPPASWIASRSIERKPPRPAGTMSSASPRSATSTDPPSFRCQRRLASAGSAIWPRSETRNSVMLIRLGYYQQSILTRLLCRTRPRTTYPASTLREKRSTPRSGGSDERADDAAICVGGIGSGHQDHRRWGNSARRISPDRSARSDGPSKLSKNDGSVSFDSGSPLPGAIATWTFWPGWTPCRRNSANSSASSPGTVKSHSEPASDVLMTFIVGTPNPTANESGPVCVVRRRGDLRLIEFEVNPGLNHAGRRSSGEWPGGFSPPGSLRTRREGLPSPGSHRPTRRTCE